MADEIGWSVDKVKKYCALENLSPACWAMIVTANSKVVTFDRERDGTEKVTPVTENLLSNPLEAHIYCLAEGTIN